MIVQDDYLKYKGLEADEYEHLYYLTEAGLAEYVVNGAELINDWNPADKRLLSQARLLHEEYTKSAYNVQQKRYRHKDIIEYRIAKNEYGEREAIRKALVLFAEVSEDTDLDRYIMSGEKNFPRSILAPLINAGIYFRGKILDYVPEDEYEVDY